MKKSVASKKDIQAIANLAPQHQQNANWYGKWTVENITIEVYQHFKINDKPIVYEANCVFTFAGTDTTTNSPVIDTETLTLKSQKTTLQNQHHFILCHGDEQIGEKGNKLTVNCNNNLLTTD